MKYVVCEKPNQFLLKEKEIPVRKRGEALLKVKKVGVCGTDLHAYTGSQAFFTYPRILGHELATSVLEIDENPKGIKTGDNVVIMPYLSCNECVACKKGKTNCCTNIAVLGIHTDGGMQEIISVPVDILLPAKNLTDNQMAIVEPLAIAAHAIRRANVQPNETVVVVGCGPIGIGLVKLAQVVGAKVIAMDVADNRLQYAKEHIGADFVVNVTKNPIDKIGKMTKGDMASVVFDATGNKQALESGFDYMSHGGRYVLVGLSKGELVFDHPKIHAKESSILCSRNATIEDFEKVMEIIHLFPTESYITHSVPYSQMIQDFDSWLKPETGVMKAVVEF